jgi:putative polyhydroxyalkanoic acid system protein
MVRTSTRRMGAVRFHANSKKEFGVFQRDLDHAIRRSSVAEMLRHSWHAQSLKIAGPGAHGTLHYREGRVHLEVRITFPATLLRDRIVGDIRRMLESASGARVTISG